MDEDELSRLHRSSVYLDSQAHMAKIFSKDPQSWPGAIKIQNAWRGYRARKSLPLRINESLQKREVLDSCAQRRWGSSREEREEQDETCGDVGHLKNASKHLENAPERLVNASEHLAQCETPLKRTLKNFSESCYCMRCLAFKTF